VKNQLKLSGRKRFYQLIPRQRNLATGLLPQEQVKLNNLYQIVKIICHILNPAGFKNNIVRNLEDIG